MSYIGVIPAYGRDYKSKKALVEDWNEGKDFIVYDFASPHSGIYINVQDAKRVAPVTIHARYNNNRHVAVIDVNP